MISSPGSEFHQMYLERLCSFRKAPHHRDSNPPVGLYHDCDFSSGASGAAIWYDRGVIAGLAYGWTGPGQCEYNHASCHNLAVNPREFGQAILRAISATGTIEEMRSFIANESLESLSSESTPTSYPPLPKTTDN